MWEQAKRAATALSKYKVTAQKKTKKNAAASEAIVGDVSKNIYQLKHEVSFWKKDRYHERLAGDLALSQERVMGKKTLLFDRKFESNQLPKLKQSQYSAQFTDSRITSELLEHVEKLNIDLKESKDTESKAKMELKEVYAKRDEVLKYMY